MEYREFSAKTVEDAITEAAIHFSTTSDKLEYEVLEKGSTGFFGIGSKPAKIRARKVLSSKERVEEFLDKVFAAMKIQVNVTIDENEEEKLMNIDLSGEDMGILIGKRGQTLDSLEYLIRLVLNKDEEEYIRVKVDTENYRQRRKDTLENLAKNISFKVKRTGKAVTLEAMNPYERRVIHSALQNDRYVETHSEGEEPNRHVVVTLKEGVRVRDHHNNNRHRRYHNHRNNNHRNNNKKGGGRE
ncbi:MAG: protein jag [Lachnospiraceae bacterium]|nr:protein jag [Lachnospiraceae bacterium]